jgi:hypothetical protein
MCKDSSFATQLNEQSIFAFHAELLEQRKTFPCWSESPQGSPAIQTSSAIESQAKPPVSALHSLWVGLTQSIPLKPSYPLKKKGLPSIFDWHCDCFSHYRSA